MTMRTYRASADVADPRRNRWIVLAATTVALSLGIQNAGLGTFSLFLLPVTHEFGWGRGDASIAFTLMAIVMTILTPIQGALADRHGPRVVVIASIVMTAVSYAVLTGLAPPIWHFYAVSILLAIAGSGTSPAIYSRIIVERFAHRRGLALGLAMAGIGLVFALLFSVLQAVIVRSGWRDAYALLAILTLTIALPSAVIAFGGPRSPEWAKVPSDKAGVALRQALALRSFRLLALGFGLIGALTGGFASHIVGIAIDRHVPGALLPLIGAASASCLVLGRLATGFLLDRFNASMVAIAMLAMPLFAISALALGTSGTAAFVVIALCAIGIGGEADIMSYLISRHFGLRAFNVIAGFIFSAYMIGYAVGPLILGYSVQLTFDYDTGLAIFVVIALAAIVPFLVLRKLPYLEAARDRLDDSPRPASREA